MTSVGCCCFLEDRRRPPFSVFADTLRAICGCGTAVLAVIGLLRMDPVLAFECCCCFCCWAFDGSSWLFFTVVVDSPAESASDFVADFRRGADEVLATDFSENWYPHIMASCEMLRGSESAITASPVINGLISARLIACATVESGADNALVWFALRKEAAWRPGAEQTSM